MNPQSAQHMRFVLYSTERLFVNNGEGFWSNTEGWGGFQDATRFTLATVQTCNIAKSEGADAKWMVWDPLAT